MVVSKWLSVSALLAAVCFGQADDQRQTVTLNGDVRLEELAPGLWWHVSYQDVSGFGRVPGNGLLLITASDAVTIDTPWTDEQTGQLFDWVEQRFKVRVGHVIATHSHGDCMGGLAEAHRRGAVSYAFELTGEFARRDGLPIPQRTFAERLDLEVGGTPLALRYFGGGHTRDNIVVWLPETKVLFGGCLVKRAGAGHGNIAEADIASWPDTVRKVRAAYPDAKIVVPGHGTPGGREYLDYTIELTADLPVSE